MVDTTGRGVEGVGPPAEASGFGHVAETAYVT
ncbi:hypothetical protein BJY27_001423 [Streptomyces rapamycinicus]|uniref:Uncharacterized protein n=1 Tax=Streptomyces rapamycinicus TaxID=1226757 RepID=A0ABR6LDQ0_9ACTN|nr:hypothetical protein [Streptomyces rapamycinicus]